MHVWLLFKAATVPFGKILAPPVQRQYDMPRGTTWNSADEHRRSRRNKPLRASRLVAATRQRV